MSSRMLGLTGFALAALAVGAVSSPASASLATYANESAWSSLVGAPIIETSTLFSNSTATTPFTNGTGIPANATGAANCTSGTPAGSTFWTTGFTSTHRFCSPEASAAATVTNGTAGWLGTTGLALRISLGTFDLQHGMIGDTGGFGFYLDGTGTFTVTVGTSSIPVSLSNSSLFIGYAGLGAVNDITVTRNTGEGSYLLGDFFESQTPIPEPASMALLGAGLVGLGALRRRRKAS